MKTSIAHNNNVSLSKGILISAYIHNSAAYVLLDGNRGYILRAENQEEEERIAAFVDQLQIGVYVFAYLTYNGRIMKLFDMLSGMELDCEDADGEPDETETFSGRLKFKTKEFLRPQYEVYTLGVIADNELRCYAYLVDVTQQMNAPPQLIHGVDVIHPVRVDAPQQNNPLQLAHDRLAELLLPLGVLRVRPRLQVGGNLLL